MTTGQRVVLGIVCGAAAVALAWVVFLFVLAATYVSALVGFVSPS
jgi:hypothetical protein